jgi:hypothetical protein
MLGFEPLCLSTHSVISLSVKTLLKHVVLKLFLLKSVRLLSVKTINTLPCGMMRAELVVNRLSC